MYEDRDHMVADLVANAVTKSGPTRYSGGGGYMQVMRDAAEIRSLREWFCIELGWIQQRPFGVGEVVQSSHWVWRVRDVVENERQAELCADAICRVVRRVVAASRMRLVGYYMMGGALLLPIVVIVLSVGLGDTTATPKARVDASLWVQLVGAGVMFGVGLVLRVIALLSSYERDAAGRSRLLSWLGVPDILDPDNF